MESFNKISFEKKEEESELKEYERMVPYEEIRQTLDSLKIKDWEEFRFMDEINLIIFSDNKQAPPVEYFESTLNNGWDIYISRSLKPRKNKEFMKAILAHELAEIAVYEVLLKKHNGDRIAAGQDLHRIGLAFENKYASENFDKQKQSEFEAFCREIRQKYNKD